MPTFPNGSRAFVCDARLVQLPEYGERNEIIEEPDGSKTMIKTVYIPSKKGEEFQIGFNLSKEAPRATHTLIKISVDEQDVENLAVQHFGQTNYCKGWSDAYSTQHMTFGQIDVDESEDAVQGDKGKQALTSYVEASWHDAIVTGRSVPRPVSGMAKIAAPVHPDSKAALCGVQVKPGQRTANAAPRMTSGYTLGKAPKATKYVARLLYRTEAMLIAQEIMPDPNPGKKRKDKGDSDDEGFVVKADGSGKKKLKAAKDEPSGVKKEGQSSQSAIDVDAAPKNQKVFMDLTGGADSDDDD